MTDFFCGVVYEATLAFLVLFRSYCYVGIAGILKKKDEKQKCKQMGQKRWPKTFQKFDDFIVAQKETRWSHGHAKNQVKVSSTKTKSSDIYD